MDMSDILGHFCYVENVTTAHLMNLFCNLTFPLGSAVECDDCDAKGMQKLTLKNDTNMLGYNKHTIFHNKYAIGVHTPGLYHVYNYLQLSSHDCDNKVSFHYFHNTNKIITIFLVYSKN